MAIDKKHRLQLQQLDKKLQSFKIIKDAGIPASGWLHAIRTTLKMSLRQMGSRLSITPQSMKEVEQREKDGSVTLKNLREAGRALGLQLVYGFVPIEDSLEAMIEKRAQQLAKEIVLRTSHSMLLEDQQNSAERINKAIEEGTGEIKNEPAYLWD